MADIEKLLAEVKSNLRMEEVIVIPDKLSIMVDKRTGVKSVSFPFQFGDGIPGFVTLTRLVKMGWNPSDDIESVTIKFK